MFDIKVEIGKRLLERAKNMARGIRTVATQEVQVGSSTMSRLLYIHCNGSPIKNIPARNVLKAAAQDEASRKRVKRELNAGIRKALIGDLTGLEAAYTRAGEAAVAGVKAQFGIIPPPNAPATIARKGSSATLIDTGALRDSIDFQIVHKGTKANWGDDVRIGGNLSELEK